MGGSTGLVLVLAACASNPPADEDRNALPTGVVECPPEDGYVAVPEGMTNRRYCLTTDYPISYRDNEGNDPAFDLVYPRPFTDAATPHPALVYLYGGVLGVDDDPDLDRACATNRPTDDGGSEGIASNVLTTLRDHDTILELVRRNDWIFVVPESNWCDLWAGLGELDPVDPDHQSLFHTETVLDLLSAGIRDMRIDDEHVYAWGTSVGATGVWVLADGYPEEPHALAGIVADSGPFATTAWYTPTGGYPDYRPQLDHILGGDPYEADGVTPSASYPHYRRVDVEPLVGEGGVDVPVFLTWNARDRFVEPYHGPHAAAAVATTYGASGTRFWARDFDHHAPMGPDVSFHTQTAIDGIPWSYTTFAALDFLQDGHVAFLPAETTCDAGACTLADEDDPAWCVDPGDLQLCYGEANLPAPFTDGTVVIRTEAEGPGTVYTASLPEDVPRGVPVTLRFVLAAREAGDLDADTPVLDLRIESGGDTLAQAAWTAGTFSAAGNGLPAYAQVDTTSLSLASLPVDVRLTLAAAGTTTVLFDGYWVAHR